MKRTRLGFVLFFFGSVGLLACPASRSKDASGTVSGRLESAADLPPPNSPAVLFVMLRDGTPGSTTPAPIAVRRYLPPFQFPLEFSIGHHDALNPGQSLPKNLRLSARIALNGSATPVHPNDWTSGTPQDVESGSRGVALKFTQGSSTR